MFRKHRKQFLILSALISIVSGFVSALNIFFMIKVDEMMLYKDLLFIILIISTSIFIVCFSLFLTILFEKNELPKYTYNLYTHDDRINLDKSLLHHGYIVHIFEDNTNWYYDKEYDTWMQILTS
ncbi:hypothetical protein BPT24_058 [Tenacibaculum phage pT24]|uniref:Uncharacterized protein n=1 Tax=Tenacibaculum phage pT24 TaxID=1880590 RepID=A0A1B4XWJ0_9CAUD|nr:hypothetical protein HYP10_gp058 [Tenacibaculum phage pT24]BAV39181.1 hypothetical protein BPT24_058 [Tenacibaculum phage pT24]